jgi:hypothetical protein
VQERLAAEERGRPTALAIVADCMAVNIASPDKGPKGKRRALTDIFRIAYFIQSSLTSWNGATE